VISLLRHGDRALAAAAGAVLAWSAGQAEPSRREWIDALRGELEVVDGGLARLLWALGGLSLAYTVRRTTVTVLRTSAFGLALGAVLMVGIIWSNVIVPSHESDDEYTAWYVVFYLGLLVYFFVAGLLSSGRPTWPASGALTGAVTAVVFVIIVMGTFIVVDNLFLDTVMTQPDKLNGFQHSGMTSQRDYVNQGLGPGIVLLLVVLGGFGAMFGLIGGLVRQRLHSRRRPAPA
jgi:hypothetical protein